jgi:hypothetical protein
MTSKTPWYHIDPADAVDIVLPSDRVQGPFNEVGDECPWPWEPIQLKGAPLGQYRCGYCGAMVMAGMDHLDYGKRDGYGLSWLDYCYLDDCHQLDPASRDRWENEGGPCV